MIYRPDSPLWSPAPDRYDAMPYARAGRSGLKLPPISLGLWHNFGSVDPYENGRRMALRAFDLGITHFDLANNYGPEPGSAEVTFGRILREDLGRYRDELIISTKAGYGMWPGPYGEWGSRKYLLASLDQSLTRMGIDYVDVFYSHRPDPDTPMEETMGALDQAVRSGKALYAGISSYDPAQTRHAVRLLRELGTPVVLHQPRYSLFDRAVESGTLSAIGEVGLGAIVFSPLAQGLLTPKYLQGIPSDSRASKESGFLDKNAVTDDVVGAVRKLQALAEDRGQSIVQLALAWVLRQDAVTSALIGASRVSQIEEAVGAVDRLDFSDDELARIDTIVQGIKR